MSGSGERGRRVFLAASAALLLVSGIVLSRRLFGLNEELSPHYLSDRQPSRASQDWGKPGRDASVDGHPLRLRGVRFPKGIGTHAGSRLCYPLQPGDRLFAAEIGIDEEARAGAGRIGFLVEGDGRVLFRGRTIEGPGDTESVRVPVSGVRELCLVVTDGGDGNRNDHADWAQARILRTAP